MHRLIGVALGLTTGIILAGCASSLHQTQGEFTSHGIPARHFLVGGGFEVFYRAPAKGTAYWVEETTAKILQTKSLEEDEDIEVEVQNLEPEDFKKVVGVDVAKAKLSLYFIPRDLQIGAFEENGVPAAKYQVGGGLDVTYKAPSDGRLIWVEQKSGAIIETRDAKMGEMVKSNHSADEIRNMSSREGLDVSVVLYFIPAGQVK